MKGLIISFLVQILINISVFSQCTDYHLSRVCRPLAHEAKDMNLSSQSRSALLEANITYSYSMVLFGKMDYLIIFCTAPKYRPIHFILSDEESDVVLFDNKEDQYVESIGFTNDQTRKVKVEVTLLAEGANFQDLRENLGCIGIPVLFRRVPRTGF